MDLLRIENISRSFEIIFRATSLLPEAVEDAQAVTFTPTFVASTEVVYQQEQASIDKIIPDASVTDEAIAELLSGEAEVLKGHGVLG